MALGAVVDDRHLPEADPGDHAADEARLLGQRQQGVERAPAHQPEIAGVERDLDLGEAREQAVEELGGAALEGGLAGAGAAHRIDDVGLPPLHLGDHLGEQFGRILEVGVDDQDALARAQIEAGGQRELVAVIARQVDRDQARIALGQRLHHRPAAVARAVVDQHDLIILAGHRRGRLARAGREARAGRPPRCSRERRSKAKERSSRVLGRRRTESGSATL